MSNCDCEIKREIAALGVTILDTEATTEPIDMRDFVAMQIIMPGVWTAADIGFQVSDTVDGNYYPLVDNAGAYILATGVAVSTVIVAPAEVAGSAFVMLWSTDGAGSDTAQGADRALTVVLKS